LANLLQNARRATEPFGPAEFRKQSLRSYRYLSTLLIMCGEILEADSVQDNC